MDWHYLTDVQGPIFLTMTVYKQMVIRDFHSKVDYLNENGNLVSSLGGGGGGGALFCYFNISVRTGVHDDMLQDLSNFSYEKIMKTTGNISKCIASNPASVSPSSPRWSYTALRVVTLMKE